MTSSEATTPKVFVSYSHDSPEHADRFIPVLLEGANASAIPIPWQGVKYYQPTTEAGYEELYRRLTGQPRTPKGKLGTLKQLPPRERKFVSSTDPSPEHPSAPPRPLPTPSLIPYPPH